MAPTIVPTLAATSQISQSSIGRQSRRLTEDTGAFIIGMCCSAHEGECWRQIDLLLLRCGCEVAARPCGTSTSHEKLRKGIQNDERQEETENGRTHSVQSHTYHAICCALIQRCDVC